MGHAVDRASACAAVGLERLRSRWSPGSTTIMRCPASSSPRAGSATITPPAATASHRPCHPSTTQCEPTATSEPRPTEGAQTNDSAVKRLIPTNEPTRSQRYAAAAALREAAPTTRLARPGQHGSGQREDDRQDHQPQVGSERAKKIRSAPARSMETGTTRTQTTSRANSTGGVHQDPHGTFAR